MPNPKQAIRSLSGIVLGYVVFVAGAWLVQEAILGGVRYSDGIFIIALAGLLTPLSAISGALLTVAIAGTRPWLHIMPMCLLIAAETTYLYRTGRVDGPLWFEALAGASLIIGAIIGSLGWSWIVKRQESKTSSD